MDLLLHLVKQSEVDLHEISISEILSGYLEYLKALETLDLGNIGDFVVMATTLMEIKSKELIPRESIDLSEELDPRDELIQQLLEYQRYREITLRLEGLGKKRESIFSRGQFGADSGSIRELADEERERELEESLDMEELDVWFLLKAYQRLLEETGTDRNYHVERDKKPLSQYIDELVGRLTPPEERKVLGERFELPFHAAVDVSEGKDGLIGCFMALLELIKQGRIEARQEGNFSEIYLALREGSGEDAGPVQEALSPELPASREAPAESTPPARDEPRSESAGM